MADLIDFTARRFTAPRDVSCTVSPYRAYRFAPNGSVRSTLLIEAQTDAEAERRTLVLADGHRAELWSRARFVAHIRPMAGPVAVSIRRPDDRRVP